MTNIDFCMSVPLIPLCWLMLVTAWVFWAASIWQRHNRVLGLTLFVIGCGAYVAGVVILATIKGYF